MTGDAGTSTGRRKDCVVIVPQKGKKMEAKSIKIDLRMFNAVKTLVAGGATIAECANYMGISTATVKYIKAAETYEEYRNIIAAVNIRKRERENAKKAAAEAPAPEPAKDEPAPVEVKEIRQSVTVQTTHFVETKIDKMIELLKILNNKLGFIVDELTGTTSNKGA
jgi:predicted DNA-binding protein (UPF0251 family)